MTNPQAVNEEGVALRWKTAVDSLHGLSFGGARDGREFHDMLPSTILPIHLQEEGSGGVELNEVSLLAQEICSSS
jgi:hypothetical protein